MTDWTEFSEGLANRLAGLPAGAVVIIGEAGVPSEQRRFVQFRQLADRTWIELCGDDSFDPELRVARDMHRWIAEAGWRDRDDDHGGNWWFEQVWPATSVDYHRLASMVVTGLRDAYQISTPDRLSYDAWNENAGNRTLELPQLGIRQESRPQ
ncbi:MULTISPECIES: hypothetical protein [unclassified Nocardia]|uniref:TY-Chap domain-containing protein n=1 Tax=unclassified Nocardia TaxID=2637762 RepID=UPI001CE3CD27|nr:MULTISPECIES: hypothetical protein [unclassified Nocardia]